VNMYACLASTLCSRRFGVQVKAEMGCCRAQWGVALRVAFVMGPRIKGLRRSGLDGAGRFLELWETTYSCI